MSESDEMLREAEARARRDLLAVQERAEKEAWEAQYLNRPPESAEGLRIEYGNLPSPPGETPTFTVAPAKFTYTGFRFTEDPTWVGEVTAKPRDESTMLDWQWGTVPWYARLLGIARLPYDVVKFIVTGRLIVIPWPWRW